MPLKPRFISLRTRFMALAVFLTLGSSAIWGGWAWQRERDLLFAGVAQEGEVLVSAMAIPIINALLYEELGIIKEGGLLDNFMAEIMANRHLHPRYAMVLDTTGKVLAHNRFSEYGRTLDDSLTRKALAAGEFTQTPVVFENERICDFATPLAIAGKRWGSLRIGISLEPLYADLARLSRQIIFFAGLFSVIALILYWVIGTMLRHPIKTLSGRMEQVGQSGVLPPPATYRRDELGLLQKSFADMVERLEKSEAERRASVERMLENERIATVGRIVSGVAHEVNNPLAGIEGALYQIEQKGGAGVQRYSSLVRKSLARIEGIVGQLSDLSRVGTVDPRPVGSRDFFEEVVLFAKMAVKEKGCELQTCDLCPPQPLEIDRDKTHQVILNLLLNAADAAGTQGRIELRARDDDGWYIVEVADNGPGVPEKIAEQIFDPFFTTKEPGKGSGMGLAISRGIAKKHGGSLTLHSSGQGAVFTLKIPVDSNGSHT